MLAVGAESPHYHPGRQRHHKRSRDPVGERMRPDAAEGRGEDEQKRGDGAMNGTEHRGDHPGAVGAGGGDKKRSGKCVHGQIQEEELRLTLF